MDLKHQQLFPPPSKGSRYIVVLSDYLTRWVEAFPVPSVEATVIARLLVNEIISRHGAPRVLLSDRGVNPWFRSKNGHIPTFFLGNVGHENVFYDILEPKNNFVGYKKKKFKKSKN